MKSEVLQYRDVVIYGGILVLEMTYIIVSNFTQTFL
jgi:hypothetical protein